MIQDLGMKVKRKSGIKSELPHCIISHCFPCNMEGTRTHLTNTLMFTNPELGCSTLKQLVLYEKFRGKKCPLLVM